jgi:hypothetical protein
MNLPKPRKKDTLESYWRRFTREQLPEGQSVHIRHKHMPKQGRSTNTIHFSIDSECKGPLAEVMDLGLRLAKSAAEEGNESRALQILDRLERLPTEYKLKQKLIQLKAEQTMLKKVAG